MDSKQFTRGKGCNNRKLSDADRAEIVRLYTTRQPDGTWLGATTLARMFGVRHPVIYRELARADVPTRSASESHRGKACRPVTNLPTGDPPPCKCGCGDTTAWNQRKNQWNRYVDGHYTQAGPQNPAYVDGAAYLPYTEDWPQISRAIRRRDGFKCKRCLEGSRKLHVHHKDRNKTNNEPTNLITLCAPCHGAVHAEMRKGVVPLCQS